jgi:hypothetical protein
LQAYVVWATDASAHVGGIGIVWVVREVTCLHRRICMGAASTLTCEQHWLLHGQFKLVVDCCVGVHFFLYFGNGS